VTVDRAVEFAFRASSAGSATVVRTFAARITPRQRLSRMIRSSVQRATSIPDRRSCAHIFRLP